MSVLGVLLIAVSACGEGTKAENAPEKLAEDASTPSEPGPDEPVSRDTVPDEVDSGPVPQEEETSSRSGSSGSEPGSVRFVSQNILHGVACPDGSEACALRARIALFMDQLAEAGCPEMVSIQEVNEPIVTLISARADDCGYEVVWDGDPGLDREVVLTTLHVIDSQRRILADRFRSVYAVRAMSPVGVVDFLTTHLASSEDRPCTPELCPPPCESGLSLRTCQAHQVLQFARAAAIARGITVVGGDLNATAGEQPIRVFADAGFVDSHLAAGHSECNRITGKGCTAGRADESLQDMTDPDSRQHSRIDYLFYATADRNCSVGSDTGLFNAEPVVGELAFPSDHTGVALTLECATTGADRADATGAALPERPDSAATATATTQELDAATADAVTFAFETFLDGSITDMELRVAQVEDLPGLHRAVLETFSRSGESAAMVNGRVDSISRPSSTTAEVIYSILLEDQIVFAGRTGEAVLVDGDWFVSKSTYCDLAALGGEAETSTVCRGAVR